jgi:hypothetical protein
VHDPEQHGLELGDVAPPVHAIAGRDQDLARAYRGRLTGDVDLDQTTRHGDDAGSLPRLGGAGGLAPRETHEVDAEIGIRVAKQGRDPIV